MRRSGLRFVVLQMLGCFRTSLLGQGHWIVVRGRIGEYEGVLGGIRGFF